MPPLLPATVPLLMEALFFPEGEGSGDSGVEGPLKEANLPLIALSERIKWFSPGYHNVMVADWYAVYESSVTY